MVFDSISRRSSGGVTTDSARRASSSRVSARIRSLAGAKLIAEPWDLGPDGYQVGRFPAGWSEWNGKYRDTVRHFWRGDPGQVGSLASRLAGSSDLYEASQRAPQASINFVTCHDGFTLQDLVSYEKKYNEANGEENRDGSNHNLSRNWGVEGPTDVARTVHVRERIKRNFLATLAFSQGVPMISHGDELGRTQRGNNNAYCQDSPLSWIDWRLCPGESGSAGIRQECLCHPCRESHCCAAAPSSTRGMISPGSDPTDWR